MESRKRVHYSPPRSCVIKTSAEIIREARESVVMKPINTKRPFTPQDPHRSLFGANKTNNARPPSSISLQQVKYHDVDNIRLPPLKMTRERRVQSKVNPWRIPHSPKMTSSLGNLPEELEGETQTETLGNWIREVRSSPKERTSFQETKLLKTRPLTLSNKVPILQNKMIPPKTHPRRKYRALFEENNQENLIFNNVIRETDETIEENDYIKPLKPKEGEKAYLFEKDKALSQNKVNEQKVRKTETNIQGILKAIDAESEKGDTEKLVLLLGSLYSAMSQEKNPKLNASILKTVFKLVERADDSLLLNVSRVILALKVNGENLSSVTKLIFTVSRSDKNDPLFLEADVLDLFVESLGRSSPLDDAETCVYGYGALKFLTMNRDILLACLKLGILELMVLHLKLVNNSRLELMPIPEQTSHSMFQLTGALRNVASDPIALQNFVHTGAISELFTTLELFSADLDLISNIARTISIISTDSGCCEGILACQNSFSATVRVLNKYPGRQDIVVRLCYALGNMVAKNDTARQKLFEEEGSIHTLLSLLQAYLEKDLEVTSSPVNEIRSNSPESGSDGSIEDVIIKIIRIIANMSMNPNVGKGLTSCEDQDPSAFTQEGTMFLDLLLTILRRKSVAESEEVVMSTLSTLNNLSFYSGINNSLDGTFLLRQIDLAQSLGTFISATNVDCRVEATRVLGNLTKAKVVRDFFLEIGGIGMLLRNLESNDDELIFTTCGVLVNLMADWDKRLVFKESNGILKLVSLLERIEGNWKMARIVCQALWNFCVDSTNLYLAMGPDSTNQLVTILVDLLDDEQIFGIEEGSEVPEQLDSNSYKQWEHFATVGTNLLEKINVFMDAIQNDDELG